MLVALQREAFLEDLSAGIGLAEREVDKVELGKQSKCYKTVTVEMNEEIPERFGLLALDVVHGAHRKTVLLCQIPLDEEECKGDEDGNHGDCRSEVVVGTDLTYILVIDDDRECSITLSYHQRRSEIGHGPHEYHQCGSKYRRHAEWDYHLEESPGTADSHVCRGLQQGLVHVLHGSGNIHEHQREEFQ